VKVTEFWRKLYKQDLRDLNFSVATIRAMKSKRTRLAELVEHMGEKRKYGDYQAQLNKGSAPWR
jgi:hypothetical protein